MANKEEMELLTQTLEESSQMMAANNEMVMEHGQRAVALRDERVAEMQSAINELTESLTKKHHCHQRGHSSRALHESPGDGKHGPPEGR